MRLNRRRFIALSASAAAAGLPRRVRAAEPVRWQGVALGAAASLTIEHDDRPAALALLDRCLAELQRLEGIFSLYRPDSGLVRLNREGRLGAPPLELVALLSEAGRFWRLSEGAFDPTVQPLWEAYARHFSRPGADPAGPDVDSVRALVGFQHVRFDEDEISFARAGMGLTMNGIAQGWITDRVAELLRQGGMRSVLVDMGEIRGWGRDWRVGLEAGGALTLRDGAVATSAPDGTRFSPCCHHLFEPATCRSAAAPKAVTVMAGTATEADALSTILAVRPGLRAKLPPGVEAWIWA